jgi:hypothetical protein
MLRKFAMLVALASIFAGFLAAQGLNTQASRDDWEEINFEFNSAVLSDGYPSLLRLADLLHKHPGYHVKVEGNTDNIGSERSNERLGLARANTVKDFLVKYGANANQIDVATRGKRDPKYPGFKRQYSKTDVPRWMNRRVVLAVTDENGKTVSDGGVGEAIQAMAPGAPGGPNCCDDILKRLDEITRLLKDLGDQNAGLRRELDALKNQQSTLENQVANAPKPPTASDVTNAVNTAINKNRDPRFSLLGLNVGEDDTKNVTFTGRARFFAPFHEHFAVQMQGEYMYFRQQKEGQFDVGIVDRISNFQGGIFASFKNVSVNGIGNGTIGEGAAMFDYIFKIGKVGLFATKGFLNNAVLGTTNVVLSDGSIAPNLYNQSSLRVVDQIGASTTLAFVGNSYIEANLGYLKSYGVGDRPGGSLRFVFPLGQKFAFTVEGGLNETLVGRGNEGAARVGFQIGNFIRPKDFATVDHPIPMDVPRVRYDIVQKVVHKGVSPPVADAGPDQIGIPAGSVTLNGSNSRDPNGEQLTYSWVQETGPAVSITGANQAIATFTAAPGQAYTFRLTVRNTDGQQASARTHVTTTAPKSVSILFFNANPTTINSGQQSTLSWRVQNATSVTITPGIGSVNLTNGTVTVSPTATTTYTLTASNSTGSQSATAVVTVNQPQASFTVCTAVPMNITQGESATIYYQTLNATSVSINNGVGSVGTNGSTVVTPTMTTTYTLTANNQFGSNTCSVGVSVTPGNAPRIVKFSAAPLSIASGSSTTLLWLVENATSVTIDNGVGAEQNAGTANTTPTQTTTYTLTAKNNFGQATAQVTVTVQQVTPPPPAPTISSFTANPSTSMTAGGPVVLTCKANNATQVVISGVGPVDANGNRTVNPTTTTTYVCVAVNQTGQASANLTVPVAGSTTAGGGPVLVVTSPTATCTPGAAVTICQTVVREINLDFTGTTSPNQPLSYLTTSGTVQAVVLNPTSVTPSVQLGELFGDYFFTVVVTDSKGNQSTQTVDVQLVVTRVQ